MNQIPPPQPEPKFKLHQEVFVANVERDNKISYCKRKIYGTLHEEGGISYYISEQDSRYGYKPIPEHRIASDLTELKRVATELINQQIINLTQSLPGNLTKEQEQEILDLKEYQGIWDNVFYHHLPETR